MDSKKVRVLHVIDAFQGGGAQRQLALLVNNADQTRFTTGVYCLKMEGAEAIAPHVELLYHPRRSRWDFRWNAWQKVLAEWKPDVIHNWLPVFLPATMPHAKWFAKIPYMACYQDVYYVNNIHRLLQAVLFAFGRSDITISNVVPDAMVFPYKQIFEAVPHQIIPNCVDVHRIVATPSADLASLGIDPTKPTIIFIGRLMPQKNLTILLQAVAKLRDLHPQLIVCGDGRLREQHEQEAKALGIAENTFFLGYRQDVYQLLKASDIFVLPSFHEGMPNVLFEALASQTAVIVSDILPHSYWIKHGLHGLLFTLDQVESLVANLRLLIENKEKRHQLATKGFELALAQNIEQYVETYQNCYLKLATKQKSLR